MVSNNTKPLPFRLDGKIALVTGSGRGIGAAMATELGRAGAKVVVNYAKSKEPAEKLVEEIKQLGTDAVAIQADVGKVPETVRLFDEAVKVWGGLDIVCSNAGVVSFGHLEEVTEEEFDRVFAINTRGQFFVAREAYKHLNEGGRIILMSSNTANAFAVPRHSVYAGSKGAIESLVKTLKLDCGKKKITINAVAPGGTVSDMFHDVSQHYIPGGEKYTAEQRQEMAAHASPLVRNGWPVDVANAVIFLASREGEWINGKVIGVDGGA
ncbi:17-beta-hydroxysteroid dehydrogenase [Apiospora rasikravindrae]|uniref:17-beta-hydroxysteroid dehydrogenase n=1 Tax=Apiospora rasikravindrae TaxID=990691 RepID=A0ABR1RXS4_9PEZI